MIIVQALLLALGFIMLIKGADWFVDGCSGIAEYFRIPQIVIGLTIVAMGTSMPEAAVSITAAAKKTADIAVGNIVGSNIFNILFVLGVSSVIIPVGYQSRFLIDGVFAIYACLLLWGISYWKHRLGKVSGAIMLLSYTGYFLYLIRI